MSHYFVVDVERSINRRNLQWYHQNLLRVLEAAKEKQVRGLSTSIELARDLMKILDEKAELPAVIPPHEVIPKEDDSLMKPIDPKVVDILYKSAEKGSTEEYMKQRNKLSPEDKFYFRIVTSWDYGWQQKDSLVPPRDVNRGRCAILRDTFYRHNNVAPDPKHYIAPASAAFSICSEYSCNFN